MKLFFLVVTPIYDLDGFKTRIEAKMAMITTLLVDKPNDGNRQPGKCFNLNEQWVII